MEASLLIMLGMLCVPEEEVETDRESSRVFSITMGLLSAGLAGEAILMGAGEVGNDALEDASGVLGPPV